VSSGPVILLPWPPASLSGHNDAAHWSGKSGVVKKHRMWAKEAALAAKVRVAAAGDIVLKIRFTPPDRRGDRLNFYNRAKPFFDGIADALNVNDSRFVPSGGLEFAEPKFPGKIEIFIIDG
jgi:hypothetical protein